VEFSPEDASRTEPDFLFRIIEKTIAAGAKVINIPDTVGYTTPNEFRNLIESIFNSVPNINKAIISVHCHNDLGLAVANSISAIQGGARQVECTINGVGERAGNASLEEIVMGLHTRKDIFPYSTGIQTQYICDTSRLVSALTGMLVQPNKAIVGRNAFAHESGIHQDGVIKERRTYEIINPRQVGFGGSNIVLGKHSGRHAFVMRLEKMGYKIEPSKVDEAFSRFKELADKKKQVFEEDLRSIVETSTPGVTPTFFLESMKVTTHTGKPPKAEIMLRQGKRVFHIMGSGDGPVDAAYKTLDKVMKLNLRLLDYNIRSVTIGKDAQGEVLVLVRSSKGLEVRGRGVSTDVIEASVRAYLDAANKIVSHSHKKTRVKTRHP
jgi:2-isopropylmalate synthase